MLLSRWIKNERLNIELENSSLPLDFGLRDYHGRPISFVKYKFNSNDGRASLYEWLSADGYNDTQYIGFFELDTIRDWLSGRLSVDMISKFTFGATFFIFNLDQVFSLKIDVPQISKEKLENPKLEDSIIRKDNALQYFTPPVYYEYYEDGTRKPEPKFNPGEIDIVASNMAVYGILPGDPKNMILLYSDPNHSLINTYSDNNVKLINHVLSKMRAKQFISVYDDILNKNQLRDILTKQLQDLYFQELKKLIDNKKHSKYKEIKDYFIKIKDKIEDFIIDDNNIQFNYDKRYEININIYSIIFRNLRRFDVKDPTFFIDQEVNKYIDINFIGALLNIASFLNNPITNRDTIDIFTEVKNIADEEAEIKYIGEKRKYTELKKLYSIESII